MPGVRLREGETFDGALRRFKKQCEKAGVLREARRREFYEKPSIRKKKKAIAAYRKALELDATNAMAHYNLGVIYAKEKDFPKAIEEWETAIKLDSKDENILNSLAWAYEKQGKKKEALIKLDQSIKLSPYNPKTHFTSGRIKHDIGDTDGAIDSLKKATRLDPNYGDAYYRLGLTYDSQNQSYDAISSLMVAEIIYHKTRKEDLLKKTRSQLNSFFKKYQAQRSDFKDLQLPETLKGYDLHKRPNRIRTSNEK